MNYLDHLPFAIDAVVLLCVVFVYARLLKLEKHVGTIATNRPDAPATEVTIRAWARRYETLPKHSPKWKAYRARLIEVGYLDKDGNRHAK